MDPEMALTLAVGMLERGNFHYELDRSRAEIRVPFGSTVVYVSSEKGTITGKNQLTFRVPLVEDFSVTAKNRLDLLEWVNQKNRTFRNGRFCLIVIPNEGGRKGNRGAVHIEFELLADNLQQEEFEHVTRWLGGQGSRIDDEFAAQFGGHVHVQPQSLGVET